MRKALLAIIIVSFLVLQPAMQTNSQSETYQPKNLGRLGILVLLDGLDYRVYETVSTPNLDSLGSQGYIFKSESILPSSTTAATAAIATGAYPNASGVVHTYAFNADEYHNQLPGETPLTHYFNEMLNATTIFESLFDKGVHTALIAAKSKLDVVLGKSGAVEKYYNINPDNYLPVDPHEPTLGLAEREQFLSYLTNLTIQVIENFKLYIEKGEDAFIFLAYPEPDWSGHATGPNSLLYQSIVEFIDNEVGRIINKLKELNLWERTLMILTPDHGYSQVDPLRNLMDQNDKLHLLGLTVEHVISPTAGTSLFIYLKYLNDTQKAVNELLNYPWVRGIWTRVAVEGVNGTLEDIGLNTPYAGDIFLDIEPPYYASRYENYGAHGGTDARNIPIILTGGALDTSVNITSFNQLLISTTFAKYFGSQLPSKAVYTETPVRFKPSATVDFTIEPLITEPNSEVKVNITFNIVGIQSFSGKIQIDVVDANKTEVYNKTVSVSGTSGNILETVKVGGEGVTAVYVYIIDDNGNILGGKAKTLLVAVVEKPPRNWDAIVGAVSLSIILALIMVALPIAIKKGWLKIKA